MHCTKCKVGPGKFEGEQAIAALAYAAMLDGASDAMTGDGETTVDWFRAPFHFDTQPEWVADARKTGYCDACINDALACDAKGLALWQDSSGFVYCRLYATTQEFEAALREAERVEEEQS